MLHTLQLSLFCGLTAILLHIIQKKNCAIVVAITGIVLLCINMRCNIMDRDWPYRDYDISPNALDRSDELFDEGEPSVSTQLDSDVDTQTTTATPPVEAEQQGTMPVYQNGTSHTDTGMVETPPVAVVDELVTQPTQNHMMFRSPPIIGPIPILFEMEGPYGEFIAEHTGPPRNVGRWRTTTSGPDQRNRVGPPPKGRDRLHRIEPIKTNPGYNSQTGRLSRYAWLS